MLKILYISYVGYLIHAKSCVSCLPHFQVFNYNTHNIIIRALSVSLQYYYVTFLILIDITMFFFSDSSFSRSIEFAKLYAVLHYDYIVIFLFSYSQKFLNFGVLYKQYVIPIKLQIRSNKYKLFNLDFYSARIKV